MQSKRGKSASAGSWEEQTLEQVKVGGGGREAKTVGREQEAWESAKSVARIIQKEGAEQQ